MEAYHTIEAGFGWQIAPAGVFWEKHGFMRILHARMIITVVDL
jgi:hypothetical protein